MLRVNTIGKLTHFMAFQALVGEPSGPDMMGFNSHKSYGPLGYAHLFANWEVDFTDTDFSKNDGEKCLCCYQSLHALRRI
jgi:hypothetical protein